eukprot:TRINITY_DN7831_c0_g1_i2.p1 TRINITY_DN7831_c0_g1~~TRINITY_DN7831_c0_g1_i2.p1  ORF type:complete len:270 (+),score=78.70 TRINITY_DN7831_c0_g1_i2:68-877(+)
MWTIHAKTEDQFLDLVAKDGNEWQKTFANLEKKYEGDSRRAAVVDLLIRAAKEDDVDIVVSLVGDSRINPNSRNAKGWTALLRASKSNSLEVLKYLIKQKADLDTATKEGNGPLHKAAKHARVEVAHLLLKAQANPNAENKGKATPLMIAAMHKESAQVVPALLEHGAVVNLQKDVGYTALMLAARFGNCNAVSALLLASADMEVEDKQGETALQKAWKHYKMQAADLLIQNGAKQRGQPPAPRKSMASSRGAASSRGYASSSKGGGYR